MSYKKQEESLNHHKQHFETPLSHIFHSKRSGREKKKSNLLIGRAVIWHHMHPYAKTHQIVSNKLFYPVVEFTRNAFCFKVFVGCLQNCFHISDDKKKINKGMN